LIHFETFCLGELEKIQDCYGKLGLHCLLESLRIVFIEILEGEAKMKFEEAMMVKLRKLTGNTINREESQYFKLLEASVTVSIQNKWIIKPKNYLSQRKKQILN
jgi:hypothetical protein